MILSMIKYRAEKRYVWALEKPYSILRNPSQVKTGGNSQFVIYEDGSRYNLYYKLKLNVMDGSACFQATAQRYTPFFHALLFFHAKNIKTQTRPPASFQNTDATCR